MTQSFGVTTVPIVRLQIQQTALAFVRVIIMGLAVKFFARSLMRRMRSVTIMQMLVAYLIFIWRTQVNRTVCVSMMVR